MRETEVGLQTPTGLSNTPTLDLNPPASVGSLMVPELQTQLKPEQRVDFSKFSPDQMRRIQQIAQSVSLDDTGSMMSFAMEPQRHVNDALDELVAGYTAADAGVVGEITIELATAIKRTNLTKMKREANGEDWVASSFGKLPVVGQYFSAFRHYQLTHKKISGLIEKVEDKANKEFTKVKAGVNKLDSVFDVTLANIQDLELYVAAGHIVLEHARKEFAARAVIANEKRDPILASALRDYQTRISTFETRLVRMHLGVTDSLLSLPQIRQAQQAGNNTMFTIMDTMLFDMPKLKRAIIMLGALKSIRDASANDAKRQAAMREVDQVAGDTVSEVYLASLKQQGEGINRLADLTHKAETILQTLAQGAELETQNAVIRKQVIEGVSQIKHKFVSDLQAQSDKFVQNQARLAV
jgi:uncharacterized protein YaaN involved in tellurite resistance